MKSSPVRDFLFLAVLLALTLGVGHCATSAPKRGDNGLGVVLFQDNPFMYNFGRATHGAVMNYKDKDYTVIEFQPVGGRMIFPESILFCDNHIDEFEAYQNKIVVVAYEREAHYQLQGIGCHEMLGIFPVAVGGK